MGEYVHPACDSPQICWIKATGVSAGWTYPDIEDMTESEVGE